MQLKFFFFLAELRVRAFFFSRLLFILLLEEVTSNKKTNKVERVLIIKPICPSFRSLGKNVAEKYAYVDVFYVNLNACQLMN